MSDRMFGAGSAWVQRSMSADRAGPPPPPGRWGRARRSPGRRWPGSRGPGPGAGGMRSLIRSGMERASPHGPPRTSPEPTLPDAPAAPLLYTGLFHEGSTKDDQPRKPPIGLLPGGRAYRKPRLSPFASVEGPPASCAALPHPAYAAGLAQDQRRAARNRASEEGSIPCAMLTGHYLLSSRLELWKELERHHLDVVDTRGLAGPDGSDLLNVVLEQPAHGRSVRVRTPRSPGALSMNSRRPVGRPAPCADVGVRWLGGLPPAGASPSHRGAPRAVGPACSFLLLFLGP